MATNRPPLLPLPLHRGRAFAGVAFRNRRVGEWGETRRQGSFGGTTRVLEDAARLLRQRMTPAERRLWQELRRHRVAGFGFRRQHPFGSFVLDFACPSRRLCIEVDGAVHEAQAEQDAARTEILQSWGWHVVRFSIDQVMRELPAVIREIADIVENLPLAPGHRRPDALEYSTTTAVHPPPVQGEG